MTVTAPERVDLTPKGSQASRLVRAEILKIRTTNTWWLLLLGVTLITMLTFTINALGHHFNDFHPPLGQANEEQRAQLLAQAALARTHAGLARIASDLVTSGQFFGVMFALLMGTLVVTNEYFHQTATATFMTSPHRSAVMFAKLAASVAFALLFFVVSTGIDLVATPVYLGTEHVSIALTDPTVMKTIGLNLLAFVMWAVLGVGLGVLIRSQIGATVTGLVSYLVGYIGVALIFQLLYHFFHHSWVLASAVIFPTVAGQVMIHPGPGRLYDHAAPQWVGLLVMIGWSVVLGGIGILLTRKRDVN